jgi:hypothetical protein
MRIRTTTAGILAVLALTLTACSGSSDGGDGKPAASTTAAPSPDPDQQYLQAAHRIEFNGTPTDEELLEYPGQWCDALQAGHSVEWLFSSGGGGLYPVGLDWGTVKQDAHELLVAGVKAYCPDHADTVLEELRATDGY